MFYANRAIYYTMTGSKNLFRRAFSPDTAASSDANQVTGGVISPVEQTVVSGGSPADFSNAGGMFIANGSLWYATSSDGKLHRAPWNGRTVTGPSTLDALATGNWAAPGVFVSPTAAAIGPPTAGFTSACSSLTCSFDASSPTAPRTTITSYAWDFGDLSPAGSGVTTSHTYSAPNTYQVTLTITTAKGDQVSVTNPVIVSNVVTAPLGFVAQATTDGDSTTETLTVPANVAAGNGLVLIATGATGGPLTAPAGWAQLGTSSGANASVTTTAWQKVATGADHGTAVTVNFPAIVHGTVQLLAYSGTDATSPVVASASEATQITASTYATPTSTVPAAGDVVISFWSAKSPLSRGGALPPGRRYGRSPTAPGAAVSIRSPPTPRLRPPARRVA